MKPGETMLPTKMTLIFAATGEVVDDVERLARGVLGAEGWPAFLEEADELELLATLLGDAVILERRYAARDGIEARPWLFERLRLKARDWRRAFYGRDGRHRTLPDLPRIGEWEGDGGDEGLHHDRAGFGGGSHGAPSEVAGDRGDPGLDALRRLLEGGDRALLREVKALGLGPPPGARGRTEDARRELEKLERARLARLNADAPVAA